MDRPKALAVSLSLTGVIAAATAAVALNFGLIAPAAPAAAPAPAAAQAAPSAPAAAPSPTSTRTVRSSDDEGHDEGHDDESPAPAQSYGEHDD